jgi:hypothetical protein
MQTYTMFGRRVSRKVHKKDMLRLMREFTARGLRGTPVHKQQQCFLIRNRYEWGRNSRVFTNLLARFQ